MLAELCWSSYVGRVDETRLPCIMLNGELKKKRPAYGSKERWRDLASTDLKQLNLSDGWQELCQNRDSWYKHCQEGISQLSHCGENLCSANLQPVGGPFYCQCGRVFRRAGDCTRHQKYYKSTHSKGLHKPGFVITTSDCGQLQAWDVCVCMRACVRVHVCPPPRL